jgi:hypothetical protein
LASFRLVRALLGSPLFKKTGGNSLANCAVAELIVCLYPRMLAIDQKAGPRPCVADSLALGAVFCSTRGTRYVWIAQKAAETRRARIW